MRGKLLGLAKNRNTVSMPNGTHFELNAVDHSKKRAAGPRNRPSERKAGLFLAAGVDFNNGGHFSNHG
jgi:hypothetical protein